jgi:hypothetical protein
MSKNPQDADQSKSRRISIPNSSDKSPDTFLAELALNGVINSATLAVDFSRDNYGELSLTDCIRELSKKTRSVHAGNLQDAETLLTSQAFALDAIFMCLARRAQMNMDKYLDATDRYMRLALKAQGQCRATLETLANLKNPPVVVARQANITNGPQQVNNTVNNADGNFQSRTHARAGAENLKFGQNELLEDKSHEKERVDFGTSGATVSRDTAMATVGEIHRPAQL